MKIISFIDGQSGKDWLDWRKNGIGASDIGVIMGSNTYKTLLNLWDEKCGFKGNDYINPAMAHGIANEAKTRDWINKDQKLDLIPLCLEDIEQPFLRASLDGYDSKHKVLAEIKCPVTAKIIDQARENQNIPLYWSHQIQWQIMLCKPTRAFVAIWDYRDDSYHTVECFAQPALQKKMREKAIEFWRNIQMGILPKPSPKDYVPVKSAELKELLLEYHNHVKVAKTADEIKKKLRSKIVEYGDDGNFSCNGYLITRCSPRLIYDMDKMREHGINIDSYLKKNNGIGYYRISCPE